MIPETVPLHGTWSEKRRERQLDKAKGDIRPAIHPSKSLPKLNSFYVKSGERLVPYQVPPPEIPSSREHIAPPSPPPQMPRDRERVLSPSPPPKLAQPQPSQNQFVVSSPSPPPPRLAPGDKLVLINNPGPAGVKVQGPAFLMRQDIGPTSLLQPIPNNSPSYFAVPVDGQNRGQDQDRSKLLDTIRYLDKLNNQLEQDYAKLLKQKEDALDEFERILAEKENELQILRKRQQGDAAGDPQQKARIQELIQELDQTKELMNEMIARSNMNGDPLHIPNGGKFGMSPFRDSFLAAHGSSINMFPEQVKEIEKLKKDLDLANEKLSRADSEISRLQNNPVTKVVYLQDPKLQQIIDEKQLSINQLSSELGNVKDDLLRARLNTNTEILSLKSQLEDAKRNLSSTLVARNQISDPNPSLIAQINSLQTRLSDADEIIGQLRADITLERSRAREVKTTILTTNNYQERIDALNREIEDHKGKLMNIERQLSSERQAKIIISDNYSRKQDELDAQTQLASQLRSQLNQANQAVSSLNQQLNQLNQNNNGLSDLSNELSSKNRLISQLKADILGAQLKIKQLMNSKREPLNPGRFNNSKPAGIDPKDEEIQRLAAELESAQVTIQNLQEDIINERERYELLGESSANDQARIQDLMNQQSRLRGELQNYKNQLIDIKIANSHAVSTLQARLETSESRAVAELERRLNLQHQAEVARLRNEINQIKQEKATLESKQQFNNRSEMDKNRQEIISLKNQLDKLIDEKASLVKITEDELQHEREERSRLQNQLSALAPLLNRSKEELLFFKRNDSDLNSKLKNIITESESKNDIIEGLRKENERMKRDLNSLQLALNEFTLKDKQNANIEMQRVMNEIARLQRELANLRRFSNEQTEQIKSQESIIESLKNDNNLTISEIDRIRKEKENSIKEVGSLMNQKNQLLSTLRQSDQQIKELSQSIVEIRKDMIESQIAAQLLLKQIENANKNMEEIKQENIRLRTAIPQIDQKKTFCSVKHDAATNDESRQEKESLSKASHDDNSSPIQKIEKCDGKAIEVAADVTPLKIESKETNPSPISSKVTPVRKTIQNDTSMDVTPTGSMLAKKRRAEFTQGTPQLGLDRIVISAPRASKEELDSDTARTVRFEGNREQNLSSVKPSQIGGNETMITYDDSELRNPSDDGDDDFIQETTTTATKNEEAAKQTKNINLSNVPEEDYNEHARNLHESNQEPNKQNETNDADTTVKRDESNIELEDSFEEVLQSRAQELAEEAELRKSQRLMNQSNTKYNPYLRGQLDSIIESSQEILRHSETPDNIVAEPLLEIEGSSMDEIIENEVPNSSKREDSVEYVLEPAPHQIIESEIELETEPPANPLESMIPNKVNSEPNTVRNTIIGNELAAQAQYQVLMEEVAALKQQNQQALEVQAAMYKKMLDDNMKMMMAMVSKRSSHSGGDSQSVSVADSENNSFIKFSSDKMEKSGSSTKSPKMNKKHKNFPSFGGNKESPALLQKEDEAMDNNPSDHYKNMNSLMREMQRRNTIQGDVIDLPLTQFEEIISRLDILISSKNLTQKTLKTMILQLRNSGLTPDIIVGSLSASHIDFLRRRESMTDKVTNLIKKISEVQESGHDTQAL